MKLANADYDIIMRDYDRKLFLNRHLLEERKREVYERIPALKSLDDALTSASAEFAKKALFLSSSELTEVSALYTDKKARLLSEKERLLTEAGLDKDYLSETWCCPLCKDTGYVCGEKCHCFHDAAVKLLKSREALSRLPENAVFSKFNPTYYPDTDFDTDTEKSSRENAVKALHYSLNFANTFGKGSGNILLYGNTGTGKTFLSGCIANAVAEKSFSVSFVTAFQFFSLMERSAFNKAPAEELKLRDGVQYLLNCDLLVLDDIGTEVVNTFTTTRLYECINERLLKNKATIISTNLSPFMIKQAYSERIFSRLASNYHLIKLTGTDIRYIKEGRDFT